MLAVNDVSSVPSLLQFYHRLAVRLHRFRGAIGAVFFVAVGGFAWSILAPTYRDDNPVMLACVVLALWTLSLFVLTQLFIRPPPTLHGKKGFIRRLGARMAIALRWVVSAGVTILGIMVLVVSARALLLVFKAVSG